jgi:hypothetical protein
VATVPPFESKLAVNWFAPVPVGIAFHELMLGVVCNDSLENHILAQVTDRPRKGRIGVELTHRHHAIDTSLSFLVNRTSSCTVNLVAAKPGKTVDWTDGAAIARDTLKPNLNDLYTGNTVYKVLCAFARAEDVTTFADTRELIRRIAKLTGGAKQVAYLVGWQHDGHDTGYPDVFTINKKLGTYEDFRRLVEDSVSDNALVSLHDNYHDTYVDSPVWDPRIVCINPDGQLRKGGIWGGGQAYEIGPTKYAAEAEVRAKKTVKWLKITQSTHLDVLSDKPDMVDFDPTGPAGRQANADAKRRIVKAFNDQGIDVTSEVAVWGFTDLMSHFWHLERRPEKGWTDEERIPLAAMILHGKVSYGGSADTDTDILDQLEHGATFSTDFTKDSTDKFIAESFYFLTIPWSLLGREVITGFERDGAWHKVSYGPASHIWVNRSANEFEVVWNGVTVVKNFTTTAPLGDGRIGVYSRDGGPVEIPVKALGLDVAEVVAFDVVSETRSRIRSACGKVTVLTEPGRPIILSRT